MAVTVFTRTMRAMRDRRIAEPIRLAPADLLRLSPVELVQLRYFANADNLHERRIPETGEVVFEE